MKKASLLLLLFLPKLAFAQSIEATYSAYSKGRAEERARLRTELEQRYAELRANYSRRTDQLKSLEEARKRKTNYFR